MPSNCGVTLLAVDVAVEGRVDDASEEVLMESLSLMGVEDLGILLQLLFLILLLLDTDTMAGCVGNVLRDWFRSRRDVCC